MLRPLLALLLTAALAPATPARDPLQAIDDCLSQIDSELDVGYVRIAARCPDLAPALTGSAFAPWLPADWQRPDNELSAAGLSELRAQLMRESEPPRRSHAQPRSAQAAQVISALAPIEQPAARGWWQRLKQWLRGLMTTHPQADEAWLRRWLADLKVSSAVSELIGWAALAVVVVLAAAIVINELRVAGVLRARTERARQRDAKASPQSSTALADIERAAPEEQPRLLLELIASRLAMQRPLASTRALTARELERQARLPQAPARAWLAELVAVCERVRFSADGVSRSSLAAAVHSGRQLLRSLEPTPPGASAQEA